MINLRGMFAWLFLCTVLPTMAISFGLVCLDGHGAASALGFALFMGLVAVVVLTAMVTVLAPPELRMFYQEVINYNNDVLEREKEEN